jgi:hypothetical protein
MAPPYHFPRARRILELPVYRCTKEQYYREQNVQYEAEAQSIEQSFQRMPDKDDPVMRARHREYMEYYKRDWHTRYERPWDFNEIVAWIRLYARSDFPIKLMQAVQLQREADGCGWRRSA